MSKVQLGIIGLGHWGPNLVRNFSSNPRCELTAICDASAERLDKIHQVFPQPKTYQDPLKLIQDPSIQAVVIGTPTYTHFELTQCALEANKHVFVEKPLATRTQQCLQLNALAQEKKLQLFVGHIFVYNSGIQATKKYIQSGELGRIYYIQMTRTNLGPIRKDVNALWDLAPHDLSILRYWFEENPSEVITKGGKFLGTPVDDAAFITLSFPSGLLANIHVSWLNPKKVREIVVVGEKKMLLWDDMNLMNPIQIFHKSVSIENQAHAASGTYYDYFANIHEGDTWMPKIKMQEPLSKECDTFLRSITDPSLSLSTSIDGTYVVHWLEGAEKSLLAGGHPTPLEKVDF